jgi:hypothetical protein
LGLTGSTRLVITTFDFSLSPMDGFEAKRPSLDHVLSCIGTMKSPQSMHPERQCFSIQ